MSLLVESAAELPNGEYRRALWSKCGYYRYLLSISWEDPLFDMRNKTVQFIGLNPSTATERQDDPTIRRCKHFAKLWGYDGMVMTNLFAFRATDPSDMKRQTYPVGRENDHIIMETAKHSEIVVACWGNHGSWGNRGQAVSEMIRILMCFGVTSKGCPKHPLYLPNNATLELLDQSKNKHNEQEEK